MRYCRTTTSVTRRPRPTKAARAAGSCGRPPLVGSSVQARRTLRGGFTLLELLMAITALMIMVLVLALVFQQTQGSWGAGIRQSGAETTLRSTLGSLERDLTHAIDATAFGLESSSYNDFDGASLVFVTLDGTNRVPQIVGYEYIDGTLSRWTQQLTAGATGWAPGPSTPAMEQRLTSFQAIPKYAATSIASSNLPLFVVIDARAPKGGAFSVVSGWSEGRNRPGHPEDKIMVSP